MLNMMYDHFEYLKFFYRPTSCVSDFHDFSCNNLSFKQVNTKSVFFLM